MNWMSSITNLAKTSSDIALKMTELLGEDAIKKVELITKDYTDKTGKDTTTELVAVELINISENKPSTNPELTTHAKKWLAEAGISIIKN